jgi:hypothetical protein
MSKQSSHASIPLDYYGLCILATIKIYALGEGGVRKDLNCWRRDLLMEKQKPSRRGGGERFRKTYVHCTGCTYVHIHISRDISYRGY